MAHIITHGARVNGSDVKAYAKDAQMVTLDLGDGTEALEMSQVEALSIVRILEASIRDSQQGTFITEQQEG